jgi:hypothetical protein
VPAGALGNPAWLKSHDVACAHTVFACVRDERFAGTSSNARGEISLSINARRHVQAREASVFAHQDSTARLRLCRPMDHPE